MAAECFTQGRKRGQRKKQAFKPQRHWPCRYYRRKEGTDHSEQQFMSLARSCPFHQSFIDHASIRADSSGALQKHGPSISPCRRAYHNESSQPGGKSGQNGGQPQSDVRRGR
jgi:hypothetical protein